MSTRGLDYNLGALIDPRCVHILISKYIVFGVDIFGFSWWFNWLRLFAVIFAGILVNIRISVILRTIFGHSHRSCLMWLWTGHVLTFSGIRNHLRQSNPIVNKVKFSNCVRFIHCGQDNKQFCTWIRLFIGDQTSELKCLWLVNWNLLGNPLHNNRK